MLTESHLRIQFSPFLWMHGTLFGMNCHVFCVFLNEKAWKCPFFAGLDHVRSPFSSLDMLRLAHLPNLGAAARTWRWSGIQRAALPLGPRNTSSGDDRCGWLEMSWGGNPHPYIIMSFHDDDDDDDDDDNEYEWWMIHVSGDTSVTVMMDHSGYVIKDLRSILVSFTWWILQPFGDGLWRWVYHHYYMLLY